jgi:lipoyl(octanoyl) transferase
MNVPLVYHIDIRLSASYEAIWNLQQELQHKIIQAKREGNKSHHGYLLLCEHRPVYTLGKSGKINHLLLDEVGLDKEGIEFFKINRGGDITYHGPGQLTGYPILDMDQYYNDVHRYVRDIEEIIIQVIGEFGLEGKRLPNYTGVWVGDEAKGLRKICAIGIHMSRWVSMHGFALNVSDMIGPFNNIIPCGIKDENMTVTSLNKELDNEISIEEVIQILLKKFCKVLGCDLSSAMANTLT